MQLLLPQYNPKLRTLLPVVPVVFVQFHTPLPIHQSQKGNYDDLCKERQIMYKLLANITMPAKKCKSTSTSTKVLYKTSNNNSADLAWFVSFIFDDLLS